jgi:FMN phosphatase YigB (HAD superfamily)
MNRVRWGLDRARRGLQDPRQVPLALRRRVMALLYARRIRQLMEVEWYAARRGISGRGWRRVVYDYARRGFPGDDDPHPLFSTDWYLRHNREVVAKGMNPLVHYLFIGERAGRSPHPLFDPEYYRARARTDQPVGLNHFLTSGDRAGLSPHPSFEPDHYRAQLPQGADPTFTAFLVDPTPRHAPNPWFSPVWYVHRYPDVGREGMNPLYHYEGWGRAQGWSTAPVRQATKLPELVYRDPEQVAEPLPAETAGALKDEVLDRVARRAASVVTFDIWDTLLRRDTAPETLKLQSARLLWLLGREALSGDPSELELYRKRLAAEAAVSSGPDREYCFVDAARVWVRETVRSTAPDHERAALVDALIAHEVSAEVFASRGDAAALELLSQLADDGVKIGLVSDFYLSAAELSEILDTAGVPAVASFVIVSSDAGVAKRSGRLFELIRTERDLAPSSWVHVGDSHPADVIAAEDRGIGAVHYINDHEIALRERHEETLRGLQQGNPLFAQQAVARDVGGSARSSPGGPAGEAERYGARIAPLIGGYALFALERALRAGVDTMYFFTREGELVGESVRELINADVFGLAATGRNYPRLVVLEVSRLATFTASLDTIDQSSLMRMWTMYSTQSPMALGRTLKVSPEVLAAACRRVGLRPDKEITEPWASPQVGDLLKDPEFMTAANQQRRYDREALLQYLESHGIARDGSDPLFVVDMGWRGTIQDNLAYLLPDRTIHGIYLGLLGYLNPQLPNVDKSAWLFDKNKDEELGRWVFVASAIETLFNAAGGSVLGYTIEDGITVIRDTHTAEEEALEKAYRPVQRAALAALPAFARRVRLDGLTSRSLRGIGLYRLDEYVGRPPSTLARGFERVQHNETFGLGKRVRTKDEPSHLDVAEGSAAFFSRIASEVITAPWPQGRARLIDDHAAVNLADEYRDWMPRQVKCLEPGVADLAGASAGIFMPPLIEGSGVHPTIARLAAKLADYGLETTLAFEQVDDYGERFLDDSLGRASVSVEVGPTGAASYDIAIATTAHSVQLVADSVNSSHKAHVVQDFEVAFDAINPRYPQDEISCAQGMAHLTIGHWLTHLIRTEYGGAAAGAGPGIDHGVYHPNGQERENALCLLYQPEKQPRAVELAIEALQRFRTVRPDVEVLVYGSDAEMPAGLETSHLGLITDLDELNALYNRCKAGLCISETNPSRIPFELMAAGVVPVDLYRYNNLFDYADGTGILAYQSPDSLARALASIFEDDTESTRRGLACIDHVASSTYEWETEVLANGVMSMLARGRLRQPPVALSYQVTALIAEVDRSPESEAFLAEQRRRASVSAPSGDGSL